MGGGKSVDPYPGGEMHDEEEGGGGGGQVEEGGYRAVRKGVEGGRKRKRRG